MFDSVVVKFDNLLGPLATMARENRELRDNALRSISHALNETSLYYATLARGATRDREREEQLSKIWAAAAIPIRRIDADLATLCDIKSEYWLLPEGWGPDKLRHAGIELEAMRRRYRDCLRPPRLWPWRRELMKTRRER